MILKVFNLKVSIVHKLYPLMQDMCFQISQDFKIFVVYRPFLVHCLTLFLTKTPLSLDTCIYFVSYWNAEIILVVFLICKAINK